MKPGVTTLVLGVTLAAAAAWGGFELRRLVGEPTGTAPSSPPPDAPATLSPGERRPDFSFPDLDGRRRSISEWDGRLLLVNFWATWCEPCREEVPAFVDLQARYGERGVQFVGIAVDEPAPVREFAREHGMNYPVLQGQLDAIALSRELGNHRGALPFTVLVARDGRILYTRAGLLDAERAEAWIQANL